MNYEIEHRFIPDNGHVSLFCTLTGLEPEEVSPYCKMVMRGREFIEGFRSLGFNTNTRFIKFDKDTEYPVILRCKGDIESHWFAFVYHKEIIWDPYNNEYYDLNDIKDMRYIKRKYYFTQYRLRITSMLQVWI